MFSLSEPTHKKGLNWATLKKNWMWEKQSKQKGLVKDRKEKIK